MTTCYIGLTNPKSPSNVGAILRAAGCFSADKIFYNGERFKRAAKFHTDTKAAAQTIPLVHSDNLCADVKPEMKKVVIELVEGATSLTEFVHPEHAIYLFGAEDSSIEQTVVDSADHVVYIPTIGCLNLAVTLQ